MDVTQELIDINTFSTFFPGNYAYEIVRDNMLDTLQKGLEKSDFIYVTGETGSGKTVLLKQLCERTSSISLFVSQAKPISATLEIILSDLIKQIHYLINNEPIDTVLPESITKLKIMYTQSLSQLIYYAARGNKVNFVLDGLYHVTDSSESTVETILQEIIPFGKKNLKVVVSLDESSNRTKEFIEKFAYDKKELQIIGFNSDEVKKIFSDLNLDKAMIEEIRETFLGHPSDIVELRNLLKKEEFDGIVDQIPKNIFEFLWSKQNLSDSNFMLIFSLIVFSDRELSLSDVAEIIGVKEDDVLRSIEKSSFIQVDANILKITNETYLKRLESKLLSNKKESYDLLADFILNKKNKSDYWLLTKYYEKAEKYGELIKLLDNPDYINSVISSNSMSSLRFLVESGLKGADKIDSISNLYKYSLENSLIKSQAESDNSNEIEALMLLNQEEKAISLARNSRVIEEKIHLLSIVGRIQKLTRGIVDERLLDEIKSIYDKLDLRYIGEKGILIASELISIDVDLAVKLLEKTFDLESDSNAIEKMMVALSIDSLSKISDEESYDFFENVKDKMKNPELKGIFSTMFNFSKTISPKSLIQEISKIDQIGARISFLSNWCEENDAEEERTNILKYAFEQLASSDDYKTNAGIYFKLSNQLLYENIVDYEEIVNLFESRKDILQKNGPTVFYVRMTLNLISCLDKNNKHLALDRIEELYIFTESIEDISTKLECKSHLLASFSKLINRIFYEEKLDILEIIRDEFNTELKEVTNNFAYQEELLGKALKVLANTEFQYCLDVVNTVNTIDNKEKLYKYLIKGLISQGIHDTNILEIEENIILRVMKISKLLEYDLDIYDDAFYEMMKAINTAVLEKKKSIKISTSCYHQLLNCFTKIRESRKRAMCFAIVINVFSGENFFKEDQIGKFLENAWHCIDILPNKISIGYEIVTILAKEREDFATSFLNKIQEEKVQKSQFTSEEFWNFISSLRILIHSFKEIKNESNSGVDQSIVRIKSLIENVESSGEQAILYGLLLLAISNKVNQTTVKSMASIVNSKIDEISESDVRFKSYVLIKCCPALFINTPSYFETKLNSVSPKEKDRIYLDLCMYFLTKTNSYQPFDIDTNSRYSCNYEDILEVLNLIGKIEKDSVKYGLIRIILEMIHLNKGPNLNQERLNDLKLKISETISTAFLSEKFIQHEGYKILSEYHHWMCFNSYQKEKIAAYLTKVEKIPNISDKIFCMTIIASGIKAKDYDYRNEILADAEDMIDQLNSTSEKILRLEDMADAIKSKKNVKEKHYIEKAVSMIDDEYNDSNVEKRLIDLAYQIDSEFAGSLVSTLKVKSNKLESRTKRAEKRIKFLDLKSKVRNDKGKEDYSEVEYDEALKIADACWKTYGGLMCQNVAAKKPTLLKEYLYIGARLPIEQSFPIFSWFLENSNRKSDKVGLSDFFEATYVACNFALANKQYSEQKLEAIEEYYHENTNTITITDKNLDEASIFISEKFSDKKIEEIIIVDPFFDMDDLDFIYSLYQLLDFEELYFCVLTSSKRLKSSYEDEKNEEEFRAFWRQHISSEDPPNISVTVACDRKTNETPFHDRYIISEECGIQLSGSINGLGKSKDLTMTVLSEDIRSAREIHFKNFINNNMFYFKRHNIEVNIVNSFYL